MRSTSNPKLRDLGTNGWNLEPSGEGIIQGGGHNTSSRLRQRTISQESQEITLASDATPDSLVEDMLSSLNSLPDAQGPVPQQSSFHSSFTASGNLAPNFLQRALTSHKRAKSSVATTSSASTTVGAPPSRPAPSRPVPTTTSHTRDATITQATYNLIDAATTMSTTENPRRNTLHKHKPSSSGSVARALVDPITGRKGSANSHGLSSPSSRTQSPARMVAPEPRDGTRRRSRSFNFSGSVLNRSRPIPAEYHLFDDSTVMSGPRPGLRKSSSNPNHQSRMHEEVPPDLPIDRSFPPTTFLGHYDQSDRGSSRAPSSTQMAVENLSRDPSSNFFGSSYASSVGSKGPAEPNKFPPKSSAKERPGFFKRMFGPSKVNSTAEAKAPQLPPLHVDTKREMKPSQDQQLPQTAPLPTSTDVTQSPTEPDGAQSSRPTLKQKSSFFRRRRKTVNEKDQSVSVSREESPSVRTSRRPSTSSLRQALDTYMVHDPMPDDLDLEQLENLRRKQNTHQDAYEFLRTTSPTSALPKAARPARGAGGGANNDSSAPSAPHLRRPSTSAPDSRPRDISPPAHTKGTQNVGNDATSPVGDPLRPATSPTAAFTSDAQQASSDGAFVGKAVTTPRQPKKAPPPPPLDVSSSKRDNSARSRWQFSSNQSRSNSEKANNRVRKSEDDPSKDSADKLRDPPKRPELPRAVASDNSIGTDDFTSAKSVPVVQLDEQENDIVSPLPAAEDVDPPWSPRELEKAQRIWDSQNDPATRGQGAQELGEAGDVGDRTRMAFMGFFDFAGLNILLALRDLCGRMTLKGETQQMDRIMAAFSERWCACNPYHGFKSEDVVHTICYSLLLLNTDLHVANMSEKMTQRQFVKNTVPTLRRIAESENPDPDATLKPNSRALGRPPIPWQEARASTGPMESPELGGSFEREPSSNSLAPATLSRRPISGVPSMASPSPYDNHPLDASELFVNAPHEGTMKTWESALETILKEFYTSVRQLRLPLHGATDSTPLTEQSSSNSLSIVSSFMRRTGSVISKGSPEPTARGRVPEFRSTGSRWSSKNRSQKRGMYPSSTLGSSRTESRTSLEETGSPWSPSASSTWSKSYGHTQTTMSTDSLASKYANGNDPGYQQSIGFANALSHAIIREEGSVIDDALEGDAPLLEDQALELAGAPWAKEGILQHKHHLEAVDKKAKDRNWNECFAVVEKGAFRLFSFNKPKSSFRSPKTPKGGVVGGGNWLDNATMVGSFTLRQTIANALPPPGYSKSRPFVFALSLPTGAVHLFQVGTPEIAREFVSTANYWSARLSKEPLVGGVSSVEFGWGDSVINTALVPSATADLSSRNRSTSRSRSNTVGTSNAPPSSFHMARTSSSISMQGGAPPRARHSPSASVSISTNTSSRPSLHESLRSSLDAASRPNRTRLPADRIALGEWTPPQQSLMASPLSEQSQHEALIKYVLNVEEELARHNELRPAMALAFSPRSTNAQRAQTNWERKSSYLLREIVKFRTYVDVLQFANTEAKRVKNGEEGEAATSAGATEKKSAPPSASMRGRIRKVESSDGDDPELPEETREALRMARIRDGKHRRSVSG